MMFSKQTANQVSNWKQNLLDKKAEQEAKDEKIKKMLESGEMYDKMVSEAVGFITDRVDEDTKGSYVFQDVKDGIVTISIYSAFIITPDMSLYCGAMRVPRNPKTGKSYFFDPYKFKDEEQIAQFFKDVKAQLPEGVFFEERGACSADIAPENSRIYTIRVKIDIN